MDITQDVNLITSLAPANALIYVDDSKPANRRQFTTLSAGLFGAQGAPASNEFGRLARSEDLIRRGVAGWLIRNATAALEAAKLSGVTLSDGTTSTNVSDIVASMWAEVQVSPIVTWVLGEAALEP